MSILDDLFYGNINPHGRDIGGSVQLKRILSLTVRNADHLNETLSDEEKDRFERYQDAQNELTDLLERDAFGEGFCLAVKLMAAVMNTMELPSIGSILIK